MKPLGEQVIVITGASSGIGRCTALSAARQGANVVLAARGAEALETVRQEIADAGGQALAVPTDVSDDAQVETLGQRAVDRFGRIDTWVNNAGVAVYAEFADHTPEEFRRVVEVNLMGEVYGTMVALRHLRQQGGTIINIASVEADRGVPLHSAYAASKHAIVGFSEVVRAELEHDDVPVQVTVIKPASIDTPFFQHARSKLGVEPKPIPPVYDPQLVADAVLYAATHPARVLTVGGFAGVLQASEMFTPGMLDRELALTGYALQESKGPETSPAPDTLFAPSPGPGSVRGGWNGRGTSLYTWLELHPGLRRAAVASAAVGGALVGGAIARNRLA